MARGETRTADRAVGVLMQYFTILDDYRTCFRTHMAEEVSCEHLILDEVVQKRALKPKQKEAVMAFFSWQ